MSRPRFTAGIGLTSRAGEAALIACLEAALQRLDLTPADLAAIATLSDKAAEPALSALATRLRLPLIAVPRAALQRAGAGCASHSDRVVTLHGVGSVAEAAALAAAGSGARLVLPRLILGPVTCALARGGEP